jgi:hypothetical protein
VRLNDNVEACFSIINMGKGDLEYPLAFDIFFPLLTSKVVENITTLYKPSFNAFYSSAGAEPVRSSNGRSDEQQIVVCPLGSYETV